MGTFVEKGTFNPESYIPAVPDQIHVDGSWDGNVNPSSPWTLVTARFEQSIATAENLYTLGIGYLDDLSGIIAEFPAVFINNISYVPVLIGDDVGTNVLSPPTFSGTLDLDFGSFSSTPPSMVSLPTVDVSSLLPANVPADITAAITWFEETYDTSIYSEIYTRLLADLQSGASGIGGIIEQEIYDRAQARQAIEEDKVQTEIEEYFSSTGFNLPTGALAARLQEHANGRAMRTLDLNGKIIIEQAELAQKNSQFVITAANTLESLLREYANNKNNRALDYSKAVAANAIARYAEQIRAYVSTLESNKIYVQIQIETLKAAIETNKGLVEAYSAEAQVYSVAVDAKSKRNKALTDVYESMVKGYDSETQAISENQKNLVAAYQLNVQNADNNLKATISRAEIAIKGYTAEYSLREKVSADKANIAMQGMASAYGAVNSSAGLSYSGSESVGESWSHGESRSDSYSHSESVAASIGISKSLDNTLSETHKYDEA